MNTRNQLFAVAVLAMLAGAIHADDAARRGGYGGIAYSATNSPVRKMSGYLTPKRCYGHAFAIGRGFYRLDLRNDNRGDLNAKVFTMDGRMLGMDTRPGNRATIRFFSDRPQTIRVMTINGSPTCNADYRGDIQRLR